MSELIKDMLFIMVVFGVLMAIIAGGFAFVMEDSFEEKEPYRSVTIKVAAYPSETSNVSTDNVTQFDNLNSNEQEMFLQAVEEADTTFEESSMRFSVDEAPNVFTDTRAVEYGGAVYPVFLVENEIIDPSIDVSPINWAAIGLLIGAIGGLIAFLMDPPPRHRRY